MLASVVRAMDDDHSDDLCLLGARRRAQRVARTTAPNEEQP